MPQRRGDPMHAISSRAETDTALRETMHDLRNLFGVVASARHMLDDKPSGERRALLLDAIEDAAVRGGRLTTAMLARGSDRNASCLDLNAHLRGLEPLMSARTGSNVTIRFEPCRSALPVKLDTAGLDAAVLELVANACCALPVSGDILVRTRRAGSRVWLMVADNGNGMSGDDLRHALAPTDKSAAHGTGLGRVRHFADSAHGRLSLRSRKAHGTLAVLNLPLVLKLTGSEAAATPPARRHNIRQEIRHEKRQSITA
jgi:signal transduction histidine kinase